MGCSGEILSLASRDREEIRESQRLVLNYIGLESEHFIGPRGSTLVALGLCLSGIPDRQSRRAGDAYGLGEAHGALATWSSILAPAL